MKYEISKRRAIFAELKPFCIMAKPNDFIEITEWTNGEGISVNIDSAQVRNFDITWGELEALTALSNKLTEMDIP